MEFDGKLDGQVTRNGYADTYEDPLFHSYKEMRRFLQDRFPPTPEPKAVKHVVLDADDTIWEIEPWGLATAVKPVGSTDENILPVQPDLREVIGLPEKWQHLLRRGSIELDSTLRDTLAELKRRGIGVSIASHNTEKSVLAFLDAFGLRDQVSQVEGSMVHSKGVMVQEIAKKEKIDTSNILFVNDSFENAWDVSALTQATSLVKGYNIGKIADILEFIK